MTEKHMLNGKNISRQQAADSGLAIVLILLLVSYLADVKEMLPVAIAVLVLVMAVPIIFKPFARFWLGLSHLLGTIASKIFLTLLFYGMVTPVGLLRKAIGKDSMKLKEWKKGNSSVFRSREHLFSAQDIENPY